MEEIKLDDFVTLADKRRFCIVNQAMIKDRHFACALTVPDTVEEIKDAECRLLTSCITQSGEIHTREYIQAEKDYKEIMNTLTNF